MTVKTRISLLVIAAGLVSSLLFSIAVFYELMEQPLYILDTILEEEAYRATRMTVMKTKEPESAPFDDTADEGMYPYWIEIHEQATNKMLYQSSVAKLVKLSPVKPGAGAIVDADIPRDQINLGQDESRKATFRVRTFLVPLGGRMFVVQIARPVEKLEEEIWDLILGIGAGFIFSCIALIAVSRFIAGKILEPIGRMRELTKRISEKNLDMRIPTGQGGDEFNELARTINWMLDRLQNSFIKQRNFLFDTSHELKTPLTTMRLSIDEICDTDMGNLPAGARENLLQLNNHVLRMERLVKDLLNLSSLETMTSIDPKPVHITELLTTLAADYRLLAGAHKIQMDIQVPGEFIIQGDMEKLNRAFSNILDNAVKYNVDGGRIEVVGAQFDDDLTITVTNTGPGVAKAEISKVFDQFYRVEESRSLLYGGSGLGLAIVKRIVELHGGRVSFESQQGAWTRVTVSLPRHREPTQLPPTDKLNGGINHA
jgi:two-component system, OmpR family, sensor kinase